MTKYLATIFVLFFIVSCDSVSTTDKEVIPNPTKNYSQVDSFSLKCLGNGNFENISLINLESGTLTCKLGKYENCAYNLLDTFQFKNDTLDLKITSVDSGRYTCDCYWDIYVRLKGVANKPKAITVNGQNIRTTYKGYVVKEDAEEDK